MNEKAIEIINVVCDELGHGRPKALPLDCAIVRRVAGVLREMRGDDALPGLTAAALAGLCATRDPKIWPLGSATDGDRLAAAAVRIARLALKEIKGVDHG